MFTKIKNSIKSNTKHIVIASLLCSFAPISYLQGDNVPWHTEGSVEKILKSEFNFTAKGKLDIIIAELKDKNSTNEPSNEPANNPSNARHLVRNNSP